MDLITQFPLGDDLAVTLLVLGLLAVAALVAGAVVPTRLRRDEDSAEVDPTLGRRLGAPLLPTTEPEVPGTGVPHHRSRHDDHPVPGEASASAARSASWSVIPAATIATSSPSLSVFEPPTGNASSAA